MRLSAMVFSVALVIITEGLGLNASGQRRPRVRRSAF
jgi:hypothetical protein